MGVTQPCLLVLTVHSTKIMHDFANFGDSKATFLFTWYVVIMQGLHCFHVKCTHIVIYIFIYIYSFTCFAIFFGPMWWDHSAQCFWLLFYWGWCRTTKVDVYWIGAGCPLTYCHHTDYSFPYVPRWLLTCFPYLHTHSSYMFIWLAQPRANTIWHVNLLCFAVLVVSPAIFFYQLDPPPCLVPLVSAAIRTVLQVLSRWLNKYKANKSPRPHPATPTSAPIRRDWLMNLVDW